MDCSIIICTRDRAVALAQTLEAFRHVRVPEGWQVELLVADNGSTDETAAVIRAASHPQMEIRHIEHPRPGKSRAQNAALAAARGTVMLFTDDDVEPAPNWIECMARPMLDGRCEATAGLILLDERLQRPWFKRMHRIWLAEVTGAERSAGLVGLVGASMGVARKVFESIDCFDEELGPGATGFGEETLLALQMREAGLRIHQVRDTCVIHHPDPERLKRSYWLATAKRFGRTRAYLMHHWEHARIPFIAIHLHWTQLKLMTRSLLRRRPVADDEGCPAWEISYLTRIEGLKQYRVESQRPRNYERRALRRKRATTIIS